MKLYSLTKEQAREQFITKTKEYGLKHVFSFDEMWDFLEHKRKVHYRKGIVEFQKRLLAYPARYSEEELHKFNPLKHSFADGLYIREIFNPKGELLLTKIHKVQHIYFLIKGDMSILTAEGEVRIKAPYYGTTEPGTQRIIFTHEDCVFVTIHSNPTNTHNIEELEERIVAETFDNEVLKLEV